MKIQITNRCPDIAGPARATEHAAGFDLRSGLRMELRALAGHRFFGRSYEFLWRYSGRLLEGSVTYNEAATTDSQQRVLTGVTPPADFPTQLDPTFNRLTNDVYISKALGGRIGLRFVGH